MFSKTKLATGTVAGMLTLAMTGASAFAAFMPAETQASAAVHVVDTDTSAAERGKNTGHVRALEAILGRLVRNGTITEQQKTQILVEFRSEGATEDGAGQLKRIWGRLMGFSVEYLGLTKTEVHTALRSGTSLGALADATGVKTREGLIGAVATGVTGLIDEALADGKITEERAAAAEAELLERITKFVDHVYEPGAGKDRAEQQKDRVQEFKERTKELKERAKGSREGLKERRADRKQP